MRARVAASLVVLVAGCGFDGRSRPASGDAPVVEDARVDDADIDAPVGAIGRSCAALKTDRPDSPDGPYTIDPDGEGGAEPFTTFCDMTVDDGGWTLVGKIDGTHMIQDSWLVSNMDVASLSAPAIAANKVACVDAVVLAVIGSTEVRLSNSTRSQWLKWPLPAGRMVGTWWRHSNGQLAVSNAPDLGVTVITSNGSTIPCFQNVFGILPHPSHGGGYPSTSYIENGSTRANDGCMTVAVTKPNTTVDGFDQNGNGYDAPESEAEWPNNNVNIPVHVAVWLR